MSLTPTPATRLAQQLRFLEAVDALKRVQRASRITDASRTGGGRRENSAEHSWHVTLFVEILAEHANTPIDVARVMRMMLIHDIVEIDVGDVPLHAEQPADKAELEAAAAVRLFALLPRDQGDALLALWREFESGTSADARFARAVDRLQPMLLNTLTDGGTWRDYSVSAEQLVQRTGHIAEGSATLWCYCEQMIDAALATGWLRDE